MPPYPNYIGSEERRLISSISYKVNHQQNESTSQWQNDYFNVDQLKKEQKPPDAKPEEARQETQKKRHFQVGDRVIVKNMPVKKMKELQKNHGEWNPRMEEWMGKEVLILKYLPEGDLLVNVSPMVQWILNPECVELLDEDMTVFAVGDKARLKKLPTEKMKEIQHRTASWIPILAEMKGRLCDVIVTDERTVFIRLSNGYVFRVNKGLLEKVDKHEKEKEERVFLKGDKVLIKNMERGKIKENYAKYGLKLDPTILKEKTHEGEVIYVTFGRIIHVRLLSSEKIVTCCPPILDLLRPTSLSVEKTTHDVEFHLLIQYLNPFVEIKEFASEFSSFEDLLESAAPDDMPQDEIENVLKIWHQAEERLLEDFLEKQDIDETSSKIQFEPGDRVSVRKMSMLEDSFVPLLTPVSLQAANLMMVARFKAIGRQGFVINIIPDTGNLLVLIDGIEQPLIFNPNCIDLVEKAEDNPFEVGQRYRFKNLPTKEMENLQENHGGWIPFMEDMKGKECIIRVRIPFQVETMDGYILRVNPKLIESEVLLQHHQKSEKCFQVDDFVKVKDMEKDDMKKLFARYGVPTNWANEIYRMRNKIGQVFEVTKGRIIHIRFNTGHTAEGAAGKRELMLSCRQVLELVKKEEIPDIVKEFKVSQEESIDWMYCSQGRVSLKLNAAGGMFTVDACPSPEDLLLATATGNIQATRFILKQHPQWVDVISDDGEQTALMNACISGNISVVKELVENGARIDLENIHYNTPTIIAAWRGEEEILQYLLDRGSKLDKQNLEGLNAIHAAIIGGSEECFGLLLERCDPRDFKKQSRDGVTPRLLAIRSENDRIINRMLNSDIFDAADKDDDGALPLHEAALWNNVQVAKICLEKNPKGINEKKQDQWTPLHLAAFNNNIDVLKLLIEHGCNMDEVNEDAETPLFLAVENCDKQVVELLLEANADPNIPNEDGETCLHHIFKRQEKSIDHEQILESSLLPEPIKISTPTKSEWLDLARALISKRANTEIQDHNRKTPMDLIKDETFRGEILVLIDALDSVEKNLKDFQQKIEDMSLEDRLHRVYLTNNFAVRYFGIDGGILEIESANVRMYVPPGAIKGQEQLIYIYLDPVNTIQGKISPVVEVGPPGTTFNTKITLSYPHCAANESEWKFSTMISEQSDSQDKEWKDVEEEDVETFVKRGRVVIKTPHFTIFTTKAVPVTRDSPVQKNMRIGAFGKDHKKGQTTYQFRVRTWDDYATQSVWDREERLESKPIDADRPLLVRHNNEDVTVKVNNIKKGWKQRQRGNEHRLRFSDVWENNLPSCTVDLDKTKTTDDQNVHCSVKANQKKSPKREHVDLSISPTTVSEDGNQDEGGHRDAGQGLRVLLGLFPSDLPGMPEQLYLDLCAILNLENEVGMDWRCIADELNFGELRGMALVNNIKSRCTTTNNDSPANFVLRHYLYDCRALSDNPLDDLKDLFTRKRLGQCLRLVEDHIRENNPQHG